MLSAILYILSSFSIFMVIVSYVAAYRITPVPRSNSILSLIFFVTSVWFVALAGIYATITNDVAPWSELRSFLLFVTSSYFLYTTWFHKEVRGDKKKIADDVTKVSECFKK